MNGDLIFIDFKGDEDQEQSSSPSELKSENMESKAEKIKRLSAQIESGEYEVSADKLAETLVAELSDDLDFE